MKVTVANDPSTPVPVIRSTADIAADMPRNLRITIRNALASRDGWTLTDEQKARLEIFVDWLRGCQLVAKNDDDFSDGLAVIVESGIATQTAVDNYLAAWPEG